MNRSKDCLGEKNCMEKTRSCPSSGTSNYSTCSDNPENAYSEKDKLQTSQSIILAGQVLQNHEQTSEDTLEINNETNYSVNILDQNLDIFTEDDDVFMDCKDNTSKSDSHENNDSTKYMQLESMSNLLKMKSSNHFYNNYSNVNKLSQNIETAVSESSDSMPATTITKSQTEQERLLTIMEETEVTYRTNSIVVRKQSPVNVNNTGQLVVEMVDQLKKYDKINKHDGNSTKRVLFANKDNIMNDQECRTVKPSFKNWEKTPGPLVGKTVSCTRKGKAIDENSNNHNHNTTESFVLWEKYCQSSEKLASRRSFSFSELNSVTESCGGDDEYSTSFKTLDDTYLSNYSFETINGKGSSKRKCFRHRSKSCDSLLKEVKHLPHILYDRFLKCLANEIQNMRKQSIVCTCQRPDRKHSNKENDGRNSKHTTVKPTVLLSKKHDKKETNHLLKISPLQTVRNKTRLSPDTLLKNSSQNVQRLSPKSPNKTPTTPSKKRGLYCWQKEIVSPVGEYIKGKRQSPFKSSPSKKKV